MNNPKELFDKAYSELQAGQIQNATQSFKLIADNPIDYGYNAANIAHQRIAWYCIPLEAFLKELDLKQGPVNISTRLHSFFTFDSQNQESSFESFLTDLESMLARYRNYLCIGNKIWILKSAFEEFVKTIEAEAQDTFRVKNFRECFASKWPDFCSLNPNFPEDFTLTILRGTRLSKSFTIDLVGNLFQKALPEKLKHEFKEYILNAQEPVTIEHFLRDRLNIAGLTDHSFKIFVDNFKRELDSSFILLTENRYLVKELLTLENFIFSEDSVSCLSTWDATRIIKIKFPNLSEDELPPLLLQEIEKALQSDLRLISGDGRYWFLNSDFQDRLETYIAFYSINDWFVSSQNIVDVFKRFHLCTESFEGVRSLVLKNLEKYCIKVAPENWFPRFRQDKFIDSLTRYIIENGPVKLDRSISFITPSPRIVGIYPQFLAFVRNQLELDVKVICTSSDLDIWKKRQEWDYANNLLHTYLTAKKTSITNDELIEFLVKNQISIDINADSRFTIFPNGSIGLSAWVWLNDLIYEYLSDNGHLHEFVVVQKVIDKLGQKDQIYVYDLTSDSRFGKDDLNRYYCKYVLTSLELERLLIQLGKYAGIGRSLEALLHDVINRVAATTNAEETLKTDQRFMFVDGLWYRRDMVFRNISDIELKKVYDYFCTLPKNSTPISLEEVGNNAFQYDGRFTDLNEKLELDTRFIKSLPGFWGLSSWSSPDLSRSPIKAPRVNSEHGQPINQQSTESREQLTSRTVRTELPDTTLAKNFTWLYTLTYLDILHGNVRINRDAKNWLDVNTSSILLITDQNQSEPVYIDDTHSIINIKNWLNSRNLTFGDRIFIRNGADRQSLSIRPLGQRDEKMYQDGLRHKDLGLLIEEAKQINMSFHDLMIKVMESIGQPLHREDIFQLVNLSRTASRNTIFTILSLPDCPYEELRYFVNQGRSSWKFDRQRKEKFDMKMNELEDQNASLQKSIEHLTGQIEIQEDRKKSMEYLRAQVVQAAKDIQLLKSQVQDRDKQIESEKRTTSERVGALSSQISILIDDKKFLVTKMETALSDKERLSQQVLGLQNQLSQFESGNNSVHDTKNQEKVDEVKKVELQKKIIGFQSQLDFMRVAAQEKNKTLEEHSAHLRKDLITLNEQFALLNHQYGELNANKNQVELELATLKKQQSSQLEEAEIEKNDLRSQLEASKQTVSSLQRLNDALSNKNLAPSTQEIRDNRTQRQDKIDRVLSSPIGRLISKLMKLNS